MKTVISDLHCHSTLRLFNGDKNIWFSDKQNEKQRDNSQPNYSEAEFSALAKGKVRLVFIALYPIEQGFITNLGSEVDLLTNHPLENEIVNFAIKEIIKKLSNNGSPVELVEKIISKYISGMKFKRFNQIRSFNHDYFNDLIDEYNYLLNGTKKTSPNINSKNFNIKIVSNYNELKSLLNIDENYNYTSENDNNIAIVLTVEGGHSLGLGQQNTSDITFEMLNDFENEKVKKLFNKVKNNISILKSLSNGNHSPFFLTFAHHFWNQLCGQNMSFAKIAHKFFDQRLGINLPITEFGKKVIYELLSTKNGRRILIDTKHMSVATKLWYYDYIKKHNAEYQDKIPIISSHSAVRDTQFILPQNDNDSNIMDEVYENSNSTFNIWDINLSDEEILIINESEGIIGLNFDERILSSKKMLDNIKKYDKNKTEKLLYQSLWAEPLTQNILHIFEVVTNGNINNKEHVWEMITLGTDFDGIINPIDAYCYAEDLEDLRNILIQKLENNKSAYTFLQNKNIAEIIDGIMFKNSIKFLSKHFNYNKTENIIV